MRFSLAPVLICLSCLLAPAGAAAQDALFSQTFASPLTLSPALAGLFPGRYRVAVNHRSQWGQAMATPFSTSSFAADFHYDFHPKRRTSDGFGAGVLFHNDRMADAGFSVNQVMVGGAYHKRLDARGTETLSAGFQAGVVQRTIGYGDLTFEDEFNGLDGYLIGAGGEVLPENSVSFGDYQIGINYSLTPQSRTAVFAGVSLHHLSQPEQSFYALATAGEDIEVTNTLYSRYGAYVNFRIPLSLTTQLSPRAYAVTQGPHAMVLLGTNLRLLVNDSDGTAFHVGAHLRGARSVDGFAPETLIGFMGLEVADFLFGFSYDASVRDFTATDRNRSAFELSATFTGLSDDDAAVPCPKF
ncbi:PorP/SprF family type IX secretion system membrane protein [Neolewinella litorea]|uniref:Type IX secretion system membrane protein PorP/SprF n=1 Tax=Neolewinella litorea TaxID=2562452 RepID=A0A4S4NSD8_9BACT|nr:PorP/SprF family type IX secretion system membrane protein [Neolewinella litorea]THH41348.1 type IX secretion system membrane protein PorP/SprF [Neolewinella litorea]